MFRAMSGFKAQYHDLTLLVICEFNDWRVLLYGPSGAIQGTHQFSEEKAKEHAVSVARAYLHDFKQEEPDAAAFTWAPTAPNDWLVWR